MSEKLVIPSGQVVPYQVIDLLDRLGIEWYIVEDD